MERVPMNFSSGRVTFSKRRADLALIVFSPSGRTYEFSRGDSLARIVQRHKYHSKEQGKLPMGCSETQGHVPDNRISSSDLLDLVGKQLDEPKVDELSMADLLHVEEQLCTALEVTRAEKAKLTEKIIQDLQEKEIQLREENKLLKEELAAAKAAAKSGGDKAGTSNTPHEQPRTLQFL